MPSAIPYIRNARTHSADQIAVSIAEFGFTNPTSSGCVLDQLSWQMQRSGLLTAAARLVAQGEPIAATTAAGTSMALGLQRFGHFNGTVTHSFRPETSSSFRPQSLPLD